jgi:uncharacterized protein YkwD
MLYQMDQLEPRRLLAAVSPTANEQFVVELINRARANPAAEAARLGIALNEGLPANTISTAAKQPLAISPYITDAARNHSQWMIDTDKFQHAGAGGSSPHQRMTTAGYSFVAPAGSGENIGYRRTKPSVPNQFTTAGQLHSDLFIDAGIADRGHRTNMLNPSFREMGAGIVSGGFNTFNAVMLTTDFAYSGNTSFITGVAYNDTVTSDNLYTPGEAIGGATITARRIGSGESYTTTTFASGGYNLGVPAGKYVVAASGPGFAIPLRYPKVDAGSENVKRDFRPADAGIIRGNVFNDINRNGMQDSGESGVPGLLIYIDAHKDGRRNLAELYARTNVDGAYKFTDLAPGVYRVRATLPAGQTITSPTSGFHEVTLGAGKIVGGRRFGNAPAAAAMSLRTFQFSSTTIERERVIEGLV